MLVVPSTTRMGKNGIKVRVKFPFGFSRVQEAYILISLQNFCPNLGQTYEHIKTHFAAPIGQEIEKIVKKSQK